MTHKELNDKALLATDKFLDRRALIFIEEAIGHYAARHGIEKTCVYLEYMIEYLSEFNHEEKK